MTFTSFEFFAFFLFVLLGRCVTRNNTVTKWFLLVTSIFFCLISSVSCAIVILFITFVDFFIGRKLGQIQNQHHRKRLLIFSLVITLGLLGFFKYTNFFLENIWFVLGIMNIKTSQIKLNITAPPGISFFTFASVSYIIDVYYNRLKPCHSFRDYALFLSFFPKLLSGPIARAVNFLPQLKQRIQITALDLETGLAYILLGAVKKLVIADQVASHVNMIFSSPGQYDAYTLLQGLLGYTVQLYCDFSGYSDMAIGAARLLGYKLPENFQMPFSAATITEFWRRWHITMSNWFRDYLFFPLEMARRKSLYPIFRTCSNLIITYLVCGLWHGAGWGFVIWGGIHAVAMAIEVLWKRWNLFVSLEDSRLFQVAWTFISHILTLGVLLLSLIFFRSESVANACTYLTRLIFWTPNGTNMISPYILPGVAAVFFVHLFVNKNRNWSQEIPAKAPIIRILVYTCLLILLVTLGATDSVPFVYFQF
ncbi:MAG: MBOAT family O-acyltransferase [Smithellaceae bacterium]|jgi:alginate O-acetyltransferase complex protein AlgI|nr:MBOAT family protein [Syntrophaceae bacterium]